MLSFQKSYGRNPGKLETDTHVQGLSTLDPERIYEPSLQSFFLELTVFTLIPNKMKTDSEWKLGRKHKAMFSLSESYSSLQIQFKIHILQMSLLDTPQLTQVVSSTLSHSQLPPKWLKVFNWSLIASHQLCLPNSTARAEYVSCFFYNHKSVYHILNPELGLKNTFQWVDSFIVAALSCYDARFQKKLNHSLPFFPFYC